MKRLAAPLAALLLVVAATGLAAESEPLPCRPIGTATMEAEGTITLRLLAEGPDGALGHGVLSYPPGHPDYAGILAHLGALAPGGSVPVCSWPEGEPESKD